MSRHKHRWLTIWALSTGISCVTPPSSGQIPEAQPTEPAATSGLFITGPEQLWFLPCGIDETWWVLNPQAIATWSDENGFELQPDGPKSSILAHVVAVLSHPGPGPRPYGNSTDRDVMVDKVLRVTTVDRTRRPCSTAFEVVEYTELQP